LGAKPERSKLIYSVVNNLRDTAEIIEAIKLDNNFTSTGQPFGKKDIF